jgi:hypothetical protein
MHSKENRNLSTLEKDFLQEELEDWVLSDPESEEEMSDDEISDVSDDEESYVILERVNDENLMPKQSAKFAEDIEKPLFVEDHFKAPSDDNKPSLTALEPDYVIIDVNTVISEPAPTSDKSIDTAEVNRSEQLVNFISDHPREIMDGAKLLWSSKTNLGIIFSTATTALYAPTLAASVAVILAISAALEYSYTNKSDKTLAAIGLISTITGVGFGVPIIHKLAIGCFTGLTVACGGASLLARPSTIATINFMMSIPGYMLTTAATYGFYSLLNTETFKNTATQTMQDATILAKNNLTSQIHEQVNGSRIIGIPVGNLTLKVINPIINKAVDRAADKAISKLNNLGNHGQTTCLQHFKEIGEKYLKSLVSIPEMICKFTDLLKKKSEVQTDVGLFEVL